MLAVLALVFLKIDRRGHCTLATLTAHGMFSPEPGNEKPRSEEEL
jgi:hypothetical protein